MDMTEEQFIENLNDREKELFKRQKNSKDELKKRYKPPLISPLNDLIKFNPFQYEPYYKLIMQQKRDNSPKALYIADEVGAGKTIETGIILTELIYHDEIDLYSDRCVIICPNLLCRKWRDTLKILFGIPSSIIYSISEIEIGLNIMSFETVSKKNDAAVGDIKMLVIDEAHNASKDRFNKVKPIRENVTDYVVLLSATPLSGTTFNISEDECDIDDDDYLEGDDVPEDEIIKQKDEEKQLDLLFNGKNPFPDATNFFKEPNDYLCKNKKQDMRYAANKGGSCTVDTIISNHYVENKWLTVFLEVCGKYFGGKKTLRLLQGINSIMSSSPTAKNYLNQIISMTDQDLLNYLNGKDNENNNNAENQSNESNDNAFKLVDAIILKSVLKSIFDTLSKPEYEDKKINELFSIIENNKKEFENESNPEHCFYNHIIVFTNSTCTAGYLEERLNNKGYRTFKVTGELFESEKIQRLKQYEEVNDKMSILIITNVACEGQDLDFGNTLVNYDLDYNPVRLEQRRGRIDRFEVKKNKIFIHNFMVKNFDYSIDDTTRDYNSYSKVKKICDKIEQIGKSTGSYYEIFRSNQVSQPNPDAVKAVYNHFRELAGIDEQDYSLQELYELQKLYEATKAKILGSWGYENKNVYDLINDILVEKNIHVQPDGDKKLIVHTDKINPDFLENVYVGGTLISQILFGGK